MRNVVFLGSKKSGKSMSCNTFCQRKLFKSSENESTSVVSSNEISEEKLKIYDTPPLSDDSFNEDKIQDELVREILLDSNGSKQIDAFILVLNFDLSPDQVDSDLDSLRNMFGEDAWKSTIFLIIHQSSNPTDREVHLQLYKIDSMIEKMKSVKNETLNSNWYCRWDNLEPKPNQKRELLTKIQNLEAYTLRRYLQARIKLDKNKNITPYRSQESEIDSPNEHRFAKFELREDSGKKKNYKWVARVLNKLKNQKLRVFALGVAIMLCLVWFFKRRSSLISHDLSSVKSL
jgi:hypothetical protein